MLGLYLHVPFCSSICNYCNFNRGLFESGLKARYVAALERRDSSGAGRVEPVDTVYFGGGTPSLLEPEEIGRLIACLPRDFGRDARRRGHARDQSRDLERPKNGWVSRGGRQSREFRCPIVPGRRAEAARPVALGRSGAGGVAEARAAGFDNISLDLMMWLPEQTTGNWSESVDRLIEVGPGPRVAVPARALPQRAAQGRDGARGVVAGA